jgi:ferredoxin-NADP reductase
MSGDLRLRVVEVKPETADVTTFVFRPEEGLLRHAAGQSMTLRLTIAGETLYRTFSIASAPGGETIAMTIKAHPKGRATRWMRTALKSGDIVEARGPNGSFTASLEPTGALALVSAGSGASPLMAMLRHFAAVSPERDIAWLHWARTPADILFAGEIADLQRRCPALKAAMFVTSPAPGWFGHVGRPRRGTLSAALPDFGRRAVFCCGPEGFMDLVRAIHSAEGGDRGRFHVEHFGAAPAPVGPIATASEVATFDVRLGTHKFGARADETLLAAALRQNVVIPCGCAAGICGTCRVRLVSGGVDMRHNGGLSPEAEAGGDILACSSRPTSDVVIAL